MKGYDEENYPVSINVRVIFLDIIIGYRSGKYTTQDNIHEDSIKGLNRGHAMWRAKSNWPGALIEII